LLEFYGDDPQKSPDYGRIVNFHHHDRLTNLLASGTVYHGGQHDRRDRFIAPTVLVNVSPESPAMQEEIFGPILPVIEVNNAREVIGFVNARPSPLGLYIFSEDESLTEQILNSTASGDAGVNECTLQPIIHDLPFGGVGTSGMGKYHGEWGFRAYSNVRGILNHSTALEIGGLRYPPYDRHRALRELVIHLESWALRRCGLHASQAKEETQWQQSRRKTARRFTTRTGVSATRFSSRTGGP
jgi:aldehyde dehydrogenase (NAD+)